MRIMRRMLNFMFAPGFYKQDSLHSWYNLSLLVIFNILSVTLRGFLGNLFVDLMNKFDLTREETSTVLNWHAVPYSMSGIFVGIISFKLGTKNTLLVANFFTISGFLSVSMIPVCKENLPYIYAAFLVFGFSMGLSFPNVLQIVSSHFTKHRSKAVSLCMLSVITQNICQSSIFLQLSESYGFRGVWIIYSAIVTQCFVPLFLLSVPRKLDSSPRVREPVKIAAYSMDSFGSIHLEEPCDSLAIDQTDLMVLQKDVGNSEIPPLRLEEPKNSFYRNVSSLMKNPNFYAVLLCQTIGIISNYLVQITMVDFGMDSGLTLEKATYLFVLKGSGTIPGIILSGWLLDKQFVKDSLLLSLGMLGSTAAYLSLSLSSGWFIYLASFGCGLSFGLTSSTRVKLISSLGIETMGMIVGFAIFLGGVIQLCIPTVIGLCRDKLGSYFYLYVPISIICLSMSIMYFIIFWKDDRTER